MDYTPVSNVCLIHLPIKSTKRLRSLEILTGQFAQEQPDECVNGANICCSVIAALFSAILISKHALVLKQPYYFNFSHLIFFYQHIR